MPLPCMHFRPASITLQFELSTMIGTRAMSGSGRDVIQKRGHGLLGIEHGFVHVDVDDLRAAFDLLARHGERRFVFAAEDQLGEFAASR